MALSSRRRGGNGLEAWPGYVDALSTLLMVTIFVLLVFVLAEAFMSAALSGSNNTIASLKGEIAQLSSVLSLQKSKTASLNEELASMAALVKQSKTHNAALTAALDRAGQAKTKAAAAMAALTDKQAALEAQLSDAQAQGASATSRIAGLQSALATANAGNAPSYKARLAAQTQLSAEAARQIDLLNQQIAALRLQLGVIAAALNAESSKNKADKVKIADLGQQLNAALAQKVQTLQLYRSEFFGTLRQILSGQKNIKIVGDRFVFESDVLFPSDQATLSPAGQQNIADVAQAIDKIAGKIPPGLKWALSVDGFADQAAIHGGPYKDNFDLSAARSLAVLHELVKDGVSKKHIIATAYGAEHPIAAGKTPVNFARDRRIEFRLTSAD